MANKESTEMSSPVMGMCVMGLTGAVVVALQVAVVPYWPQPASVEPVFGWETGLWWGLIAGALVGLYIGFIIDEKHYDRFD
jgi:ABC-type xylose transport system permease subunit